MSFLSRGESKQRLQKFKVLIYFALSLSTFSEHLLSARDWDGKSKGDRERRGGQGGLGLLPQAGGSPEGLWAEQGWTDSGLPPTAAGAGDGEHLGLWLCDLGQAAPFSAPQPLSPRGGAGQGHLQGPPGPASSAPPPEPPRASLTAVLPCVRVDYL